MTVQPSEFSITNKYITHLVNTYRRKIMSASYAVFVWVYHVLKCIYSSM